MTLDGAAPTAALLPWNVDGLWRRLVPVLPDLTVEVLGRTDSTNARLLERAREAGGRADQPVTLPDDLADGPPADEPPSPLGRRSHDVQPCLLVAEQQTAGRGRLGRRWQSSAGASLTFSLSLALAPRDWGAMSLVVGLALAEALDEQARIGLKWPNDLWLVDGERLGRKLGGILIETVAVGEHRVAVIGVGLNVGPQTYDGLAHGYAHLQELDATMDPPHALERVAVPLVQAVRRFECDGFDAECRERFAARDLLRGRAVAAGAVAGLADGVSAHGALRIVSHDGSVHEVASGEITVLDPVARMS